MSACHAGLKASLWLPSSDAASGWAAAMIDAVLAAGTGVGAKQVQAGALQSMWGQACTQGQVSSEAASLRAGRPGSWGGRTWKHQRRSRRRSVTGLRRRRHARHGRWRHIRCSSLCCRAGHTCSRSTCTCVVVRCAYVDAGRCGCWQLGQAHCKLLADVLACPGAPVLLGEATPMGGIGARGASVCAHCAGQPTGQAAAASRGFAQRGLLPQAWLVSADHRSAASAETPGSRCRQV